MQQKPKAESWLRAKDPFLLTSGIYYPDSVLKLSHFCCQAYACVPNSCCQGYFPVFGICLLTLASSTCPLVQAQLKYLSASELLLSFAFTSWCMPVLECLLALNNCCISVVRVGCSRAQSLDPFSIYAHSSVSLICSCGFSLFADYSKIYITSPYISSEFQTYIQLPNLTSPLRCLTHSDSLNMSKTEHLITPHNACISFL